MALQQAAANWHTIFSKIVNQQPKPLLLNQSKLISFSGTLMGAAVAAAVALSDWIVNAALMNT